MVTLPGQGLWEVLQCCVLHAGRDRGTGVIGAILIRPAWLQSNHHGSLQPPNEERPEDKHHLRSQLREKLAGP